MRSNSLGYLRPTACSLSAFSRADSPNLAGQYASVVYKQLRDFKDVVRVNVVTSPFAVSLTEQDMQDLAAYYS